MLGFRGSIVGGLVNHSLRGELPDSWSTGNHLVGNEATPIPVSSTDAARDCGWVNIVRPDRMTEGRQVCLVGLSFYHGSLSELQPKR